MLLVKDGMAGDGDWAPEMSSRTRSASASPDPKREMDEGHHGGVGSGLDLLSMEDRIPSTKAGQLSIGTFWPTRVNIFCWWGLRLVCRSTPEARHEVTQVQVGRRIPASRVERPWLISHGRSVRSRRRVSDSTPPRRIREPCLATSSV